MSVNSNTSLRTRKKKSKRESVDDIIEKRISELGLPGLEGKHNLFMKIIFLQFARSTNIEESGHRGHE